MTTASQVSEHLHVFLRRLQLVGARRAVQLVGDSRNFRSSFAGSMRCAADTTGMNQMVAASNGVDILPHQLAIPRYLDQAPSVRSVISVLPFASRS